MVKYAQSRTFRINYANEGSNVTAIGGHFEKKNKNKKNNKNKTKQNKKTNKKKQNKTKQKEQNKTKQNKT